MNFSKLTLSTLMPRQHKAPPRLPRQHPGGSTQAVTSAHGPTQAATSALGKQNFTMYIARKWSAELRIRDQEEMTISNLNVIWPKSLIVRWPAILITHVRRLWTFRKGILQIPNSLYILQRNIVSLWGIFHKCEGNNFTSIHNKELKLLSVNQES